MRVACVLISHWRAKAEMRRHSGLKDRAALVVLNTKPKRRGEWRFEKQRRRKSDR